MSKLADKLQGLLKVSTAPLGFHPSASEAKEPAMLLIAGLSGTDAEEARALAEGHADAGLVLNRSLDMKVIELMVKTMNDIPLGVLLDDTSKEKQAEIIDTGCDFIVFGMGMPIAVLGGEKVGKFLMVEPSSNQNLVRAINDVEIDGVLITAGGESVITVEHLLVCRRFSELVNKPLMMSVPSLVMSTEFVSLWKAGIDGIVTPPAQPAKALIELRGVMEALPKEAKHRRGKLDVILPHYRVGAVAEVEEEEEEEEEDI
jgi:hypothetical protein